MVVVLLRLSEGLGWWGYMVGPGTATSSEEIVTVAA